MRRFSACTARYIQWLILCLLGFATPTFSQALTSVNARAYVLADITSGQLIASDQADERVEPASLTKLMTAYLVFQALRDGKIKLDQAVPVSEKAWKVGGSKMFIEPRKPVVVDALIRGMIVQSGNDACIALAELIAGSEDAFAQLMNREAKRLGMVNSQFMNASGLPDAQHYSSARDLYLLASALLRDFPQQYATYYALKEYRYNNITQPNRNRLLWMDPSVDGLKTGHTDAAGYCLIASKQVNGRRLLSVLLGSSSELTRAQESLKLINWGYQYFDALKLYDKGAVVKELPVWKGSESSVKAGFQNDLYITVAKGLADKLKAELVATQLVAPIAQGQRVGVLRVTLDGKPYGEYPVVAIQAVPEAGLFGRAWDTVRLWFK